MLGAVLLPPDPFSDSLQQRVEVETSCAVLQSFLRPSHCYEFPLLPLHHQRVPSPEQQYYELGISLLGGVK